MNHELERLYLVLGGHIFFQTLSTAVELDLFTLLSRNPGLTREDIASRLRIQEKPAKILLLGCAALSLVRKNANQYFNSPIAEAMLTSDNPKNIRAIVRWQNHINYRAMSWFHDAVKTNSNAGLKEFSGDEPFLYGRLTHHPDLELIFQEAMQAISVQANESLTQLVDFSAFSHLVDVGGGNGTNIIHLASKHPRLRASVFDSPTVCDIARKNIKNAGLEDRLDAIEGNCFQDPFPSGIDCVLFAHFCTIWSEEKNLMLLKKAYEVLPSGGTAIVFNMMQFDSEDGPLTAALGSPYFLTLATGEGMLYSWNEYESWMRQAGFSTVRRQELATDHGAVIGIK